MLKIVSIIFSIFFFLPSILAQTNNINFNIYFGNKKVTIGNKYLPRSFDSDSIKIDLCRFYVSDIYLLNKTDTVLNFQDSCYLIDLGNKIQIPIVKSINKDYTSIVFNLGIDSLKNVSGVMGGDLDPMNGMYWTWQSGYINFKLEGTSPTCATKNKKFQYHIGGYLSPYSSCRKIVIPISNINTNIQVNLDIEELLCEMFSFKYFEIMSPNDMSLKFSNVLPKIFTYGN